MLDAQNIRRLLESVAQGAASVDEAVSVLRAMPYEDAGFVKLDHHRALRDGLGEVIYCPGKTPQQLAGIVEKLARHHERILGTRATREQFETARGATADLCYHDTARAIWLDRRPQEKKHEGVVLLAAGTGDLPVAEEAALTLELMGHAPQRIYDVGVAGLHRLMPHVRTLQDAHVIVAVAGMDGALPSVVGGMTAAPVIAVPTSVGYGASFGGIAALLTMLNSCAAGVAVVNIDNGFGAGHLAGSINNLAVRAAKKAT